MIKFDGVYTFTIHMELAEDDNVNLWVAHLKGNMKKFPQALKEYIEDEISNGPNDLKLLRSFDSEPDELKRRRSVSVVTLSLPIPTICRYLRRSPTFRSVSEKSNRSSPTSTKTRDSVRSLASWRADSRSPSVLTRNPLAAP